MVFYKRGSKKRDDQDGHMQAGQKVVAEAMLSAAHPQLQRSTSSGTPPSVTTSTKQTTDSKQSMAYGNVSSSAESP